MNTAFDVLDRYQRGRLTTADLEQARTGLREAQNAQQWLDSIGTAASTQAISSTNGLVAGLTRAVEDLEQELALQKRRASGQGGATVAPGGYTVNVNLNGARTPINTASQADADNLAGLLSQLGSASTRAL